MTERRSRLLAVAACRHFADRLALAGSLRAIEVAERFADGEADSDELAAAHAASREGACEDFPPTLPAVAWAAARIASWVCHDEVWKAERAIEEAPTVAGYEAVIAAGLLGPTEPPDSNAVSRHSCYRNGVLIPDWGLIWQHEVFRRAEEESRQQLAALLRDITGDETKPLSFSPQWRTDTVVTLALQMYESRDFSSMPILADALQDAGCDNDDILQHCRGEGPHVRGCWVVDLVLGKE